MPGAGNHRSWRGARAAGAALLLVALGLGPGVRADALCDGAEPVIAAQLLFGLTRPDGRRIPEAAWRRFLAHRITPLFPDGLTVLKGQGQWRRGDGRLLREPARIVLIVTPDTPAAQAALHAIRGAYQSDFAQEAAGLVLTRGCAQFR